jgi:hypothetical protein
MNIQIETARTDLPFPAQAWCATLDTYDGLGAPIGFGSTEAAAIANLIEWLEDEA